MSQQITDDQFEFRIFENSEEILPGFDGTIIEFDVENVISISKKLTKFS